MEPVDEIHHSLNGLADMETNPPSWYGGNISRKIAMRLLEGKPDGTFIVRTSKSMTGCLILEYRCRGADQNSMIQIHANQYRLRQSKKGFPTLSELVAFYCADHSEGHRDLPCKLLIDPTLQIPRDTSSASFSSPNNCSNASDLVSRDHSNLSIITPMSRQGSVNSHLSAEDLISSFSRRSSQGSRAGDRFRGSPSKESSLVELLKKNSNESVFSRLTSVSEGSARKKYNLEDGQTLMTFELIAPSAPPSVTQIWPTAPSPRRDSKTQFKPKAPLNLTRSSSRLSGVHWENSNLQDWLVEEQPMEDWEQGAIFEWLDAKGFGEAVPFLREHKVDAPVFLRMDEADFKQIGMPEELGKNLKGRLDKLSLRKKFNLNLHSPQPNMSPSPGRKNMPGFFKSHSSENMLESVNDAEIEEEEDELSRGLSQSMNAGVPIRKKLSLEPPRGLRHNVLISSSRGSSENVSPTSMNSNDRLNQDTFVTPQSKRRSLAATPVVAWGKQEVTLWLERNHLHAYVPAFDRHFVNGTKLLSLTLSSLQHIMSDTDDHESFFAALERLKAKDFSHTKVQDWSPVQVKQYLTEHGLADVGDTLVAHHVGGDAFASLTSPQLVAMNVPEDKASKVLEHIRSVQQNSPALKRRGTLIQVMQWTPSTVREWLHTQGFGAYAPAFEAADVDGAKILSLTSSRLAEFGIVDKEEQHRFMLCVNNLGRDASDSPQRKMSAEAQIALSRWDMFQVATWLKQNGFSEFVKPFREQGIDGPKMLALSAPAVEKMGVNNAELQARLLAEIRALRKESRSGSVSKLTAEDSLSGDSYPSEKSPSSIRKRLTPSPLPQRHTRQTSVVHEPVYDQKDLRTVSLTKESGGGFGFVIHGGTDAHQPPTITTLVDRSPAKAADIRVGDVLVRVNEREVATLKHQEVVEIVRSSGNSVVLVLHRPKANSPVKDSPIKEPLAQDTPWYKPHMQAGDIARLLKGVLQGSFYIRNGIHGSNRYYLQFLYDGTVHQKDIVLEPNANQGTVSCFHFSDSSVSFPSLNELVNFYYHTTNHDLPCLLVPPVDDLKSETPSNAVEEPWVWWQLDATKEEAIHVLDGKATGAFVIFCESADSFLLAYAAREYINYERILVTKGKEAFGHKYYLEKAPTVMFHSLHDLVEYFEELRPQLLCSLRVSVPVDPTLEPPAPLTRSAGPSPFGFDIDAVSEEEEEEEDEPEESEENIPKEKLPPLFWLQYASPSESFVSKLRSRVDGSFAVCAGDSSDRLCLYYTHEGKVKFETIHIRKKNGIFDGYSLSLSPSVPSFPTIELLLVYYEDAQTELSCPLRFTSASFPAFPDSPSCSWCLIGTPESAARAYLTQHGGDGMFVIIAPSTPSSTGSLFSSPSPAKGHDSLKLLYLYNGECLSAVIRITRSNPSRPKYILEDEPQSFYNLFDLIIFYSTLDASGLACPLIIPQRPSKPKQVALQPRKSIVPWSWWWVERPSSEAVAFLMDKHTGGFVIAKDEARSHRYVLCYKFLDEVVQEPLVHAPSSPLFRQGWHLEKEPTKVFSSFHDLVEYYSTARATLQCALRVSITPPRSLAVPEPPPSPRMLKKEREAMDTMSPLSSLRNLSHSSSDI